MRPVLLFDVMDTLVYNPFNAEIPDFFGLTVGQLLAEKQPDAWPKFEMGLIDQAEYMRTYFSDRRTFDHAAFLEVVKQAYRWIDGTESLLQELRGRGFEIHAFSNYPIWYQTIEAKLKLSRYLNWTFVSCRTGIRKPDVRAYQAATEQLNCAPENCLFIDDNASNCDAAESIGMRAILFSGSAKLRDELTVGGLIWGDGVKRGGTFL
ncbi:MAG: HAD family phosphatase [Planctomycetales bacterium]|nr:HAD family phosphatase [Planctomycetales bacterium]